jgi:glycosyltransferase involved in cell wall biosynthesis
VLSPAISPQPSTSTDAPAKLPASSGWLFVLPWAPRSGAGVDQVVLHLMANAAAESMRRPLLMVADWSAPQACESSDLGMRTLRFRLVSPLGGPSRSWGHAVSAALRLQQLYRLWRLLSRERVEVVNVHYVSPWAWSFAVLRRLGLYRGRLVLSWHGTDLHTARHANPSEYRLFERLSRHCDANVACSKALARQLRHAFPHAAQPTVVRNGVSLAQLSAIAARPRLVPARPYLLSIAAFDHNKGHDIILKAFAAIARTHPGIDLLLIGSGGPALPELITLARQLGIADRLITLESLPHAEAMRRLAGATLFLLASRRESFGIVLLEAGFFGIPVIAARVDGIPETIRHGGNGELFRPGASVELAWRIDGLLKDATRARRLGEALRADVIASADWRHSYARYLTLFESRA